MNTRALRRTTVVGADGLKPITADAGAQAGHVTTMAAYIAGRGHGAGGRDGIIGAAPQASILSISSLGAQIAVAQNTQAVHWAVEHGAKVINMSFVGGGPSAADIGYLEQHDVVVVAGTGNQGSEGYGPPGGLLRGGRGVRGGRRSEHRADVGLRRPRPHCWQGSSLRAARGGAHTDVKRPKPRPQHRHERQCVTAGRPPARTSAGSGDLL